MKWFRGSTNRRILSAAFVVGLSTLLVKLVAALKELAVAYVFGTGDVVDAFLVAFVLPSFCISVVAGGFAAALMPVYIEARENEGGRAAERLFANASAAGISLVGGIVVLLLIVGPAVLPLLGSNFGPEKLALTRVLFLLLVPSMALGSLAVLWTVALNAEERFVLPALAPLAVPLATLGAVILAGRAWGIHSLVAGVVAGYVFQCGVLAVAVGRTGLAVWPRWDGVTPGLRVVAGQYFPKVAGGFLMSGTGLVDVAMAAMLSAGSVASLNYGNKVIALLVGVGTVALGTAVLPYFSRMVARQQWGEIRRTLKTYTRVIVALTVPTLVVLVPFSDAIVRLLFQRGAFTAEDTSLVTQIQMLYLFQLPFHLLGILFVRLVSALQANRFLMFGAAINLVVNVGLNWILMNAIGVAGIALSTSAVYLVSVLYLGGVLRKQLPRAEALGARG